MKIIKSLKTIIIFATICYANSGFAYNVGNAEKECRLPKFRDLIPPERTKTNPVPEVEPESEIGFTMSSYADPSTLKIVAKKIPLKPTIVDRNTFYKVTAQLPAELNGKYARIDIRVEEQSGKCDSKDGWLIKIKKAASGTTEPVVKEEPTTKVKEAVEVEKVL